MTFPGVDSPILGWGNPTDEDYLYPLNRHSNGLASSLVVKSGPGRMYGFTVLNTNASSQYIQVFDASTLPADGAIPACVFTAAGASNLPVQWIPWRTFQTGCVICNSSTAGTKTLGAADCFFDAQFV